MLLGQSLFNIIGKCFIKTQHQAARKKLLDFDFVGPIAVFIVPYSLVHLRVQCSWICHPQFLDYHAIIAGLASFISLGCWKIVRDSFPHSYHISYCAAEGYVIALSTLYAPPELVISFLTCFCTTVVQIIIIIIISGLQVLRAVSLTAIIVFCLTIFGAQTKWDLTMCGDIFLIFSTLFVVISLIFTLAEYGKGHKVVLISSAVGALLFAIHLIRAWKSLCIVICT